ncbi:IS3 family transposase [Streptomyces coeruleorubidus]|uniref:IS3 family transposase n=1 Tax=Streptomyces coeruleorubidus TaxID=116188 RepID=UPI0033D00550
MHGPLGEVTESDPVALAAFIGNQRTEHHVPHRVTCRVLGVSESWFYKWRDKPATAREIRRGRLADEIKRIFDDSGGTYGSPKIWITLVREGWRVSVNTVARIMAELGLAGRKIRWRPDQARTAGGGPGLRAPRLHRRRPGPGVVRRHDRDRNRRGQALPLHRDRPVLAPSARLRDG